MRILGLVTGALLAGSALAVPPVSSNARRQDLGFTEVTTPSLGAQIVVTKDNTLNGTGSFLEDQIIDPLLEEDSVVSLPLNFVNNMRTGNPVYAYISGIDKDGRVVFVRADGTFLIGMAINPPGGEPFQVTVPAALISGRVYFSDNERLQFFVVATPSGDGVVQPSVAARDDPNVSRHWGFMEFTFNQDGSLFANLSFVDFVGLILSISLQDRQTNQTLITRGLGPNAVRDMCNGLTQQAAKDRQPWNKLCISRNGNLIRVLSPGIYQSMNPDAFAGYYDGYVDRVWRRYTPANPLRVDTQRADVGVVKCASRGDVLVCERADAPFAKPSSKDVWGCATGPFANDDGASGPHKAIVPRICAAFARATLLIPGGGVQPGPKPADYYRDSPANHYSRLVHALEVDQKGYAFPYDDVNPYGVPDASGAIVSPGASHLTVYVGGSG
ncbi:Glucan endo-1 [Escovopsis weberi]|uniref:Glucan endo-1 n=1 Tax=Escovopsis weberi TaxID=150374 RepID=A0A0M8N1L5_ESCWE|nr:Glucan endo-1 [Escovopsis weberi]